jgi:hypothetical protein
MANPEWESNSVRLIIDGHDWIRNHRNQSSWKRNHVCDFIHPQCMQRAGANIAIRHRKR